MRRRTVTAIAAGVLAAAAAGVLGLTGTGTANAIANGELVEQGRYGFSVKLIMTGIPKADGTKRNSSCSGALIAPEWVITAGHCFRDFNGVRLERPVADSTVATIGRVDLDQPGGFDLQVVAVRQSKTADVSLAKLERPVHGVKPIRIADAPPAVGDVLRLTGFGATNSDNPVSERRLRTGLLAVLNVQESTIGVTGKAPQADTTPCPYDSGGPFFIEGKGKNDVRLVSVVSDGPGCPHTEEETSARVDNLKSWIQEAIKPVVKPAA